ncbi:MAG: S-layer homology domain-containing protein [Clostridia bacterium]|nr:S-layer homology domain-containing protein [Clostridia bacterium]
MKKRILSLVLVLAMCLSMVTFGYAAEQSDIGKLLELYKDRIWEWQANQLDAMTEERMAVMNESWDNYDAKRDEIRALAAAFVDELLDESQNADLAKFYGTETMKDLYKWKLMRDIMEGRLEITNTDADYTDWLDRFTAFEEANDEAISASAPIGALNGLGDYSEDLTEFFGELVGLVDGGLVFEGAGAAKATAYVNAYDINGDGEDEDDDMASIHDYLVDDVKELMVDGIVNTFDIGMRLATFKLTKENTTGLLDEIKDRDMKAAFLLVGEDITRYIIDELVPGARGQLLKLDKKEILAAVIGDATPILGGNNEAAAKAIYDTMSNLAKYMLEDKMDKIEEAEEYVADELGFVATEDLIDSAVGKLNDAMAVVHPEHGLELVHINAYLGRALLRYNEGGEYNLSHEERGPVLEGAEINGNEVAELGLGFAHNLYPVFSSVSEYGIASFDANYDADGIKVYAGDDIGQIMIEVTEGTEGEATVTVYRGYTDYDQDGVQDGDPEDVYRYVTTFTVTATSAETTVNVDKQPTVDDPTVDVSGETPLDEVKVTVKDEEGNEVEVTIKDKDGNELDPDAVSKEDFEDGIVIILPDGVVAGDQFTVEVKDPADDSVLDDADVTVGEDVENPYVILDDVLDTTVDGTIEIKGTTNLDYVTVAIIKNGETIYAVVYEKAEFEAGITLNAPDNAQEGEVYTVVVGTEKASDSDEFAIEGADETYEVVLEDVLDTTADGTITIKGTTTNLDYVTVAIVKNGETIYAVVYSKAEFEAGITLNAPDNAQEGDVYTVVVGTEKASDSDEFTIIAEGETTVNVDKQPTTADPTIEVSGETSLDEVKVTVKDENGNEVQVTIKDKDGNELDPDAVSKEDFEDGIVIVLPDGVEGGDQFTVEVKDPADDSVLDDADVTVVESPYINLEDIEDFKLSDNENAEITIKGTTNLDFVVVTVTLGTDNVYAVTHTKAEYEAGVTIALDNAQVGNVYTVAVGQTGTEAEDTFEILPETAVAPSGTLSVGKTTRSMKVGKTIEITATPQNIQPEGATVEIVWTTEDGTVLEITNVATAANDASIATITRLAKGTKTITATLLVNGVEVDSKVIKVKVPTGGGGSDPAVNITVKVDETKDVVKVPAGGTDVEFTGTGDGEVKVEIVDGVVTVTGVKEGEVKGTIKVTNEKGNVVLTGDYIFTVTEGDTVVKEHECEWPDIAVGWEGKTEAHWAHLTIDAMTINGYIKGYPDGLFKPDQNITRAEFTAIVYRILGLEIAEDGVLYDDTVGHWAQDIIATMSLPEGYGMTRGYGDGNFGPNDFITREQAVAIIARAKSAVWKEAEEGAKDIFTDAEDISWWFDGEMDAAVTNGLITGYQDGSYKPLGFTTRAEACTLLARAWPEVLELD